MQIPEVSDDNDDPSGITEAPSSAEALESVEKRLQGAGETCFLTRDRPQQQRHAKQCHRFYSIHLIAMQVLLGRICSCVPECVELCAKKFWW